MANKLHDLLRAYQQGKIGLREEFELSKKMANPDDLESRNLLMKDWKQDLEKKSVQMKSNAHLLGEIHHRINLAGSQKQQSKISKLSYWSVRVAALLTIPLLITSLFLYLNRYPSGNVADIQIVAPPGARVRFELPDGTGGTLNGGSVLAYHSSFIGHRDVKLSGEAYFNVAHDKKHPFIISTGRSQVKVTGTKFSLSAYPDERVTELVLEEGSVDFSVDGANKVVRVSPGERLFALEGTIQKEQVETWKYTAWKDGRLIFRNDSMTELARRISRWYNVDVKLAGEGLDEYTFRGVFEDDPLEEVLRLLQMTSPISYEIKDRVKLPDGTFSPKKVILKKQQ